MTDMQRTCDRCQQSGRFVHFYSTRRNPPRECEAWRLELLCTYCADLKEQEGYSVQRKLMGGRYE